MGMQDFSWNVFAATGNIESYLLYKEHEKLKLQEDLEQEEKDEKEEG